MHRTTKGPPGEQLPLRVYADRASAPVVTHGDSIILDASRIQDIAGGAIRVAANLGRAHMVLVYTDADPGGARREYVPPESLFHPDSIASLRDTTLVVWHPADGEVNAGNWRQETIGHMSDAGPAGEYLAGNIVINDARAISDVKAKPPSLCELSPGYDAISTPEIGVSPRGEAYTHRQGPRNYNHWALLPPNTGRSGRDIALRLDQRGQPMSAKPGDKPDDKPPPHQDDAENKPFSEAQSAAISKLVTDAVAGAMKTFRDEFPPKPDDEPTDEEKAKMAKEKKTDAVDPRAVAAAEERRINDSVDLREKARRVMGQDFQFVGKTSRQTMAEVCRHVDATYSDAGKSDDLVRGEFEGFVRLDAATKKSASSAPELTEFASYQDAAPDTTSISARVANAWRTTK